MRWKIALLCALVTAGVPAGSSSADVQTRALKRLEALIANMAETPTQHRALAGYYREQATEFRELAIAHRKLARRYESTDPPVSRRKVEHCDELAALDEEMAKKFEALARTHEIDANP